MRRYLLDQGELPQSLQKPMQQIKKKGNAYGATKQKRAAWTKELEDIEVKELKKGDSTDLLFFVDSCGSSILGFRDFQGVRAHLEQSIYGFSASGTG